MTKKRNTSQEVSQKSKAKTQPKIELSEAQLDAIAGGLFANPFT